MLLALQQLLQVQRRVMGLVRATRSSVEALQSRLDSIWSDTDLTVEARRRNVATALAEGRVQILGVLEDEARGGVLRRAYADVERRLGGLREVNLEELEARATVLRQVLAFATERPERLIRLYHDRHRQRADRVLIEETATAVIAALGSEDNYALRDAWNVALREVALERDPEEIEVLSMRDTLDGLSSYLDAAQGLVGADLTLMRPDLAGEERDRVLMARPRFEAEVNRYESENARVMEDSDAA